MSTEVVQAAGLGAERGLALTYVPEVRWRARDGSTLTLRAVVPGDRCALDAFYRGLSDLSRYQRFFSGVPSIPTSLLQTFVDPDWSRHIGLVVLAGDRIIADGRLVIGEAGVAEIAAAVDDRWQGHGIGRRLFRSLIEAGRARDWRHLRADFFSANRRIIGLLRDAGFTLARDRESALFGHATLELD